MSDNGFPASQAVTDTIRSAFDTARLIVLIAILVRRSMEPNGPRVGQQYWAAYSYTWGPSYYYTKRGLLGLRRAPHRRGCPRVTAIARGRANNVLELS